MKLIVLNVASTSIVFTVFLNGALSVFPFLENNWKVSLERLFFTFILFALIEMYTDTVITYNAKKRRDAQSYRFRILGWICLLAGWISVMAGLVRVHVALVQDWSVDLKNQFLVWNWVCAFLWSIRFVVVVVDSIAEDNDLKYKPTPAEPPKIKNVFTIDDEFDDQLDDV